MAFILHGKGAGNILLKNFFSYLGLFAKFVKRSKTAWNPYLDITKFNSKCKSETNLFQQVMILS